MNYPEDFSSAPLDLEIDFGDKGGIQRFKTVGDIQAWLNEEQEFWNWLHQPPANQHYNHISNLVSQFQQYHQHCHSQLNQVHQQWSQIQSQIFQLRQQLSTEGISEDQKASFNAHIEQHEGQLKHHLDQLKSHISSFLRNEILRSRNHLSRFEPSSNFLRDLAEEHPVEAFYALDQFIQEAKRSDSQRSAEHAGRMMASLFVKNLNRKIRPDNRAFEKAIVSWGKELADFKSRYEAQEAKFAEISERHENAATAWNERADQIAANFDEMRQNRESDLKNLTTTYETHMQLKGPLLYWRNKRKEHGKGKFCMGVAAAVSGIIGAGVLVWATHLILPASQSADQIPWRSIGLFVLISTFVLWLVRLFVKLMLSHIHLYADAREREVMISTFMALVRRQESREGIAKMDLALVLAPIFKPSTTGVIQDDGGPTTLTDFIGRLSGK